MKEIQIKTCIKYLFGIAILVFIVNKLLLRPWILENDVPGLLRIATYSIPNLIEAVIGTLILTGFFFQTRQYFSQKLSSWKDIHIYLLAVSIASVYVISQELKFHNLGGRNVYDPFDLMASILGSMGTFVLIQKFGFINKVEKE